MLALINTHTLPFSFLSKYDSVEGVNGGVGVVEGEGTALDVVLTSPLASTSVSLGSGT